MCASPLSGISGSPPLVLTSPLVSCVCLRVAVCGCVCVCVCLCVRVRTCYGFAHTGHLRSLKPEHSAPLSCSGCWCVAVYTPHIPTYCCLHLHKLYNHVCAESLPCPLPLSAHGLSLTQSKLHGSPRVDAAHELLRQAAFTALRALGSSRVLKGSGHPSQGKERKTQRLQILCAPLSSTIAHTTEPRTPLRRRTRLCDKETAPHPRAGRCPIHTRLVRHAHSAHETGQCIHHRHDHQPCPSVPSKHKKLRSWATAAPGGCQSVPCVHTEALSLEARIMLSCSSILA